MSSIKNKFLIWLGISTKGDIEQLVYKMKELIMENEKQRQKELYNIKEEFNKAVEQLSIKFDVCNQLITKSTTELVNISNDNNEKVFKELENDFDVLQKSLLSTNTCIENEFIKSRKEDIGQLFYKIQQLIQENGKSTHKEFTKLEDGNLKSLENRLDAIEEGFKINLFNNLLNELDYKVKK